MKDKKISRGALLLLGILLGLIAGAAFGILLMSVELTKEQMVKQVIIKSCLENMIEIGDKCDEKIRSAQTFCLFSNDLHLKESVETTGGSNGKT